MSNQPHIVYNEIDFLIPAYRFNIRFSYVTKRGLSFIREFVLRLVYLSPMQPAHIAEYLGLSTREIKEALSDLVDRGGLTYNDFGQVILTNEAKGYFSGLSAQPQVTDVLTTGAVLGFELTAFNCVSSTEKRLNDKWTHGLRVDIPHEVIANRNNLAEKAFQSQFYSLLDNKDLKISRDIDSKGRPSIYKIDSVNQIGVEPLRIKLTFSMDEYGNSIEREDIDQLENSANTHEIITQTIHAHRGADNIRTIISAIKQLGDPHTDSLISEQGIDIAKFIQLTQDKAAINGDFIPHIGLSYTDHNSKKFTTLFDSIKNMLGKNHQDGVKQLSWLAPSEEFWGRNNNLTSHFSFLFDGAKTKNKTFYKPTLYVPFVDDRDRHAKARWKEDFSGRLDHVNAYIEGFCGGAAEILLLKGEMVVVTYYVSLPEVYPVPVPIGFTSKNKLLVDHIDKEIAQYLSSFYDGETRRDLGEISKL